MSKTTIFNLIKILYTLVTILVLSLIAGFVFSWTSPSAIPPNDNVDAPLNTGSSGQTKEGGLILNTGGANNGLTVNGTSTFMGPISIGVDNTGTAGQVLQSGGPGSSPVWGSSGTGSGGFFDFGDGSDGAHTTSGNETLTSDKYYTNLTVATGHTLNPAGYRIFCTGTLTLEGTGKISGDGNVGEAGENGVGINPAGAGGAGGAALADGYLKGSLAGKTGGNGGISAVGGFDSADPGNAGTAGSNTTNSIGNNGVSGGNGGAGGAGTFNFTYGAGASGAAGGTATESNVKLIANWHLATLLDVSSTGASVKFDNSASSGSAAGGGGGGRGNALEDDGGCGGGGGGSGSSGRIIAIYSRSVIIGASSSITANGGNGGAGGSGAAGVSDGGGGGGGGGGGAGNGGELILAYNLLTNDGTISANGGTGGTGGTGGAAGGDGASAAGSNGTAGTNGTAGNIRYFNISL